ncbi:ArnT family glycosyltransferase [Nocardia sp. NPDC056000]|uniref:ArnT family glycosyltransferase n=1 Tax=Nocardia sp. NPDC056000 TaxID=3345674 RepID=UPI0035DC0CBA
MSRENEVRFATGPVVAIMAVTTVLLLARCARYDYFGDELYFLSAGRHLSPGYVDQGPLVPLLAHLARSVAPGSLVVLRISSILAGAAAIAVSAAIAREFGGDRAAQTLAALAYATCPFLITQTATLSTFAFDATLSATTVWLLIRWTRTREDRLLFAATLIVALDVQVKLLAPVLLGTLAVGVVTAGPRNLLRRSALWVGLALVCVSAIPMAWWQHSHGWPQLAMGAVVDREQRAATGGVAGLPVQFALLAGLLGIPLLLNGLRALIVDAEWRRHRFVAIAAGADIVFIVAIDGRPYYFAGYLPALFAAGATYALTTLRPWRSRASRGVLACAVAVSAAVFVLIVGLLPLPASHLREPADTQAEISLRMRLFGTSGWDRLVSAVTGAYRDLPADRREGTIVIAQTYWQAAALDNLAGGRFKVYSPNRGFALFGTPPPATASALFVMIDGSETTLRQSFSDITALVHVDDRLGFPGIDRHVTIWRCERPARPWSDIWADMTTDILDNRSLR